MLSTNLKLLPLAYQADLEEVYRRNGWNDDRFNRSISSKGGYEVLEWAHAGRFCPQVKFRQAREDEYDFDVAVALRLAKTMDRFNCYLFIVGENRPLHDPVTIPVLYGFTAQMNQMWTAINGLEYVYRVAGVEHLRYYPRGLRELPD